MITIVGGQIAVGRVLAMDKDRVLGRGQEDPDLATTSGYVDFRMGWTER
jgi:hypothetical protein